MEICRIPSVSIKRLSWTSSTYLEERWFYGGNTRSRGIVQEVDFLTGQANVTEFFQYVVSSGNGFSETDIDAMENRYHRSAASYSCRFRFSFVYAINKL
jgi:hypothetical protein